LRTSDHFEFHFCFEKIFLNAAAAAKINASSRLVFDFKNVPLNFRKYTGLTTEI